LDGRDEDIWREPKLGSTPTNLYSGAGLKGDVYGLKVSITLSGAVYDSAHLPHG
jgi:hypothetical protein